MVDSDKGRFLEVLRWLGRKYPVDGKARPLPAGEDLADYYAALRDVPIEDLEGGARWHYAHSEFYPDRPAALRRSAQEWRRENPRPHLPPEPVRQMTEIHESPESREAGARALQAILDSMAGKVPVVWGVEDLVGRV